MQKVAKAQGGRPGEAPAVPGGPPAAEGDKRMNEKLVVSIGIGIVSTVIAMLVIVPLLKKFV